MSLRTKFFIIFGVVILFIVFVVVMLLRGREEGSQDTLSLTTPPTPRASQGERREQPLSTPLAPAPTPVAPVLPPDLSVLARSFAERFGSFSNQSDFENIRELFSLMTPRMRTWADRFVTDARAKAVLNAPYYGMTTRAMNTRVVTLDAARGNAEVIVATSRREVKGQGAPRVFYQDIVLTMKKEGDAWKVEEATWK